MTQAKLNKDDLANINVKIRVGKLNIVIVDIPITAQNVEEPINNIYCIDDNGIVVWKVSASAGNYEEDPFISMKIGSDGAIKARRYFGKEYVINKDTGIAEEVGWSK